MNRRSFVIGASALVAAPAILRTSASSQSSPLLKGKRVRRRLSSLPPSDPFFSKYAAAITKMHQLPESSPHSWRRQAIIHADRCAHGTLEFLPFHRPYLDYFERICGGLIGDPNFALPYWDWTDNNGRLPGPFFADGPLNVTYWKDASDYASIMFGQLDTTPNRFTRSDYGLLDEPQFQGAFTPESMKAIQQAPIFSDFSALLESPHGSAHIFIGLLPGQTDPRRMHHMAAGFSPLDPIFWLHHANVDRIWAQSAISITDQLDAMEDPDKVFTDHFVDENEATVSPNLRDAFDLAKFGYTYDTLISDTLPESLLLLEKQALNSQPAIMEAARGLGLSSELTGPSRLNPLTLGSTEAETTALVGAVDSVTITVNGLIETLNAPRLSRKFTPLALQPLLSIENKRIYVKLQGVSPLEGAGSSELKVFINCPYLSDSTPTSDLHFAGIVSFFGCPPERCAAREFTVDITSPVREKIKDGTLDPSRIQVQLLARRDNKSVVGTKVATIKGARIYTV